MADRTPATELPAATLGWVRAAVGAGARITRIESIRTRSTSVHALDLLDVGGARHELALRRFTDPARLDEDPWYVPEREVEVLQLLEGSGVPAPELIAADTDAKACDVPTLLTTRLPGRMPVAPNPPAEIGSFLLQLVEPLPVIHGVDVGSGDLLAPYEPYEPLSAKAPPPWSARRSMWERVLDVLANPPPDSPTCLIHRDYHPENTLWLDGRLSGVVDWTTGCWGPPGIDLARTRLNLARDYGVDAAARFLSLCREHTGRDADYHPYWDLLDSSEVCIEQEPPGAGWEELQWTRFEDFVAGVLAEL